MSWNNDQVTKEETEKICTTARECLAVVGDFVELGCYKGDTAMVLAELIEQAVMETEAESSDGIDESSADGGAAREKQLWIYDSFEGLPEKSGEDESVLGVDFRAGELFATKREVKARFLRSGLRVPIIKKSWFEELTDEDLPERIAFAFLDGDFYGSIKTSLRLIEEKISDGGVIVVHDYSNEALPGVRKAVGEWRGGEVGSKFKIRQFGSLAILRR